MGRERWGQRLLALGLVVVVASSLAIGGARRLVDTESVQRATPDLLTVPTLHQAVGVALGHGMDQAYPGLAMSAERRTFAVERMLVNGDLVDEVERAIAPAHRGWLDGLAFQLELDPRVTTQVAIAGLRDASPSLVDALPSDRLVDTGLITVPTSISAEAVGRHQAVAVTALVAGSVGVVLGAAVSARRARTLKLLARGVVGFAAGVAAAVLALPWSAVNRIDDRVAVLGALLVPVRTPLLVMAAVALFVGLWLHGSADQLAAQMGHSLDGDRRRRRESAPARSGGTPPLGTRKAVRHRTEAIDAFFEPTEARPSEQITTIDLGDRKDEDPPDPAGTDGDDPAEVDSVDAPVASTPEDERAEALAAERRQALERIDGTRSGYRTHLPR